MFPSPAYLPDFHRHCSALRRRTDCRLLFGLPYPYHPALRSPFPLSTAVQKGSPRLHSLIPYLLPSYCTTKVVAASFAPSALLFRLFGEEAFEAFVFSSCAYPHYHFSKIVKNVLRRVLHGLLFTPQLTHTLKGPTHSRFCLFSHLTTALSSPITTRLGKCCSAQPPFSRPREPQKDSKVLWYSLLLV